jgi:hypothetical protein
LDGVGHDLVGFIASTRSYTIAEHLNCGKV